MASSVMVGYKSSGLLCTKPYPRSQAALSWNPISRLSLSKCKNEMIFLGKKAKVNNEAKRNGFVVYANSIPGAPAPSGPPSSNSLRNWIIGLVVSLVLPFFSNKWGPLWVLKNKIESAVQRVEDIVEAVEKVAEKVDEIADDIADDLPEGKLKDLVEMVDHVAEKTAKAADCLDNVIDKVQEAEEQMEEMIVESIAKKPKSHPE